MSFCGLLSYTGGKFNNGIIERFDTLKMASKMAVSKAPMTYMTKVLDQKHLNFDFSWMFQRLNVTTN